MPDTSISQEAVEIPGGFTWTEGDPVSLAWLVNADWSGTYDAQIRVAHNSTSTMLTEFTVTAEYDTLEYPDKTLFTMTLSAAESQFVPAGKTYFTDIQEIGGTTRAWACIHVKHQVTVP
jgi:hypothetical protein